MDFVSTSGTISYVDARNVETMSIMAQEYLPTGTTVEDFVTSKVTVGNENVVVSDYRRANGKAFMHIANKTNENIPVILPILAYDHYHAYDRRTDIEIPITKTENFRILMVIEPGYNGEVVVQYEVPMVWRIAELVSLLTLIGVMGYCIRNRKMCCN